MKRDEINLIIGILRRASRFLIRDYIEIVNISNSTKNRILFLSKSYERVLECLSSEIKKYYKNFIFSHEVKDIGKINQEHELLVIDIANGKKTLYNSLPFWSITVSSIINQKTSDKEKLPKALSSIIYFPIQDEIYYTNYGHGVFTQQIKANYSSSDIRIRNNTKNFLLKRSEILIISELDKIDIAKKISPNVRIFDSLSYSIAMLLSGKIDLYIAPKNNLFFISYNIFIHELGGFIKNIENTFYIFLNYSLMKYIELNHKE